MNSSVLKKYQYPSGEIDKLIENYRKGLLNPSDNKIVGKISCPSEKDFSAIPEKNSTAYKSFYDKGMSAIMEGKLGVLVLNGGMATRFGGVVKGIVEVYGGMSFIELKVKDAFRISQEIRFFIMNSFATEKSTLEFIENKNYFGRKERIKTFSQYAAPRITENGQLFFNEDEKKQYYGPGHGDLPYCFRNSGLLDEFIIGGGKYIFFSNVDNLGARVDPAILGFHINSGSELTAEVAIKSPGDEGGAPAIVNRRLQMVEGFSFPEGFDSSKISVFNCSTYWADASAFKKDFNLPWYTVEKTVEGAKVVQFEHLAGDMTRFFKTEYLIVPRDERFYPIKKPQDLADNRDRIKALLGL